MLPGLGVLRKPPTIIQCLLSPHLLDTRSPLGYIPLLYPLLHSFLTFQGLTTTLERSMGGSWVFTGFSTITGTSAGSSILDGGGPTAGFHKLKIQSLFYSYH